MTNKCKECGGTLVFDPDIQMMVCEHCCAMVPVEETTKEHNTIFGGTLNENVEETETEFMDFKVYDCKNCGATLAITDAEISTYCAYCGQPTIVFSRIEKRKRPKSIIPFKITKNEAISRIRETIFKSDFVEDQIKYFKPEFLRGIYVPYGLFCYEFTDSALMRGSTTDPQGKTTGSAYFFRKAMARIGHIPVDASYQLNNDSADRLEPYYGKDLVEFDEGYLSGYYADLKDEDFSLLRSKANGRAMKMFEEKICAIPFTKDVSIIRNKPEYKIIKEDYALLPVYFCVFDNEGTNYTIMVNGQTGKVVGAVPTTLKAFIKWYFIILVFALIAAFGLTIYACLRGLSYAPIVVGVLSVPTCIFLGIENLKKYKKSLNLTTAKSIQSFASKRTEV